MQRNRLKSLRQAATLLQPYVATRAATVSLIEATNTALAEEQNKSVAAGQARAKISFTNVKHREFTFNQQLNLNLLAAYE